MSRDVSTVPSLESLGVDTQEENRTNIDKHTLPKNCQITFGCTKSYLNLRKELPDFPANKKHSIHNNLRNQLIKDVLRILIITQKSFQICLAITADIEKKLDGAYYLYTNPCVTNLLFCYNMQRWRTKKPPLCASLHKAPVHAIFNKNTILALIFYIKVLALTCFLCSHFAQYCTTFIRPLPWSQNTHKP